MSSFFNVDNKLFSTLGKVWDLILLNLIWMGFCTIWFFILFQFIPQSSAAVPSPSNILIIVNGSS